jgi:hypothetical protein
MPRMRQRAERLAPIHKPPSPDNLPAIGKKRADTANRDGVAERLPDPAVQKRLAVDLPLIDTSDRVLRDLQLDLVPTATAHEAHTFARRRSIPGLGTIVALGLWDEIHAIQRFPRMQAFGADGRLVHGAKASAGKRDGPAGTKLGTAARTWACSEAAGLF